jgi:hypothetical protein
MKNLDAPSLRRGGYRFSYREKNDVYEWVKNYEFFKDFKRD